VLEPYLSYSERDLLEPLSVSKSKKYFFLEGLYKNPTIKKRFYLYHPDLGPENIMIFNQKLSAIIN
jgi:hypothetical protein